MRALTVDEVRYVSGGTSPPPPPAPSTPSKPAEKPKEEDRKVDSVVVVGFRAPNGVGGFVGGGWIGGSVGRPGPVIQPVKPADPEKPEIKVEVQPDAIDVMVPVNTSREARQRFWGRAYGTPPAAIP